MSKRICLILDVPECPYWDEETQTASHICGLAAKRTAIWKEQRRYFEEAVNILLRGKRMKKISIKRNTCGDTRTAASVPTFTEFNASNDMHRWNVRDMLTQLSVDIEERGNKHDITKFREPFKSLFYRELCAKIEGKMDSFEDGEWYPMHCKTERHHLNEYCPDDVNLIDVIEMICDCVCAGLARSGSVYPVTISSEILQKAIENTVKMCADAVEVVEK